MIEVEQRPEEGTVTAGNSCYWTASCTIAGQVYTARSRRGAPHELARRLVGAGIPDQAMIVRSFGLKGHATYRSLHAMARHTFEENSGTTPRRVKWREPAPDLWAAKGVGEGQNRGVSLAGEGEAPPGLHRPETSAAISRTT